LSIGLCPCGPYDDSGDDNGERPVVVLFVLVEVAARSDVLIRLLGDYFYETSFLDLRLWLFGP
jgi:hypothetical protein